MNTKEILDTVKNIIKRQDFDRTLGLFLLNTILKDVVRDNRFSIFETLVDVTYNGYGEISITDNNIRNIVSIEWISTMGQRKFLRRVKHYEQARHNFDFTEVSEPNHYVTIGETIKILPIPSDGVIEIYAEVYPIDLVDSTLSFNSITKAIGNCLSYIVAGEYFDMLQEEARGKYWREKGALLLDKYVSHIKQAQIQNINIMYRNPWGNLPAMADNSYNRDLDDYDAGTF